MTVLTVTSKGQVTLRKDLLEHLGVRPGDKIAVDFLPGGKAAIRADNPRTPIDDFIGCLKTPDTPSLTLEEIKTLIEEGWAGKR